MKEEKEKKKLKSRILSAVVIFIGVVLVFVGYWAMQQLLQRRQERLLSQSGETRTAADEEADEDEGEPDKLTADELQDILIRSALVGETNPHEPYGRQMTMQEAIETGQAWIDGFCAKYAYPSADGTVSYEGISAALYTGQINRELLEQMMQAAEGVQTNKTSNGVQADAGKDADADGAQTGADSSAGGAQTGADSTADDAQTDADSNAGDAQTDVESATENSGAQTDVGSEAETVDEQTDGGETVEPETTEPETGSAFLPGVELSEDSGDKLSESMYGYWELTFSGNDMNITLRMNAVTGQVLYVSMECSSYTVSVDEVPLDSVLLEYAESFELGNVGDAAIESAEDSAFATHCTAEYKEEILFAVDSYVYDAAELGYPADSGYTQSGFTMYVGVEE